MPRREYVWSGWKLVDLCISAPRLRGNGKTTHSSSGWSVLAPKVCVYEGGGGWKCKKKISTETHNHVQSLFMGPTSECRSLWNAEFYAPVDSESARMCFRGFCRRTRLVGCFFFFCIISKTYTRWWLFVCWTFSSPCLSEQGLWCVVFPSFPPSLSVAVGWCVHQCFKRVYLCWTSLGPACAEGHTTCAFAARVWGVVRSIFWRLFCCCYLLLLLRVAIVYETRCVRRAATLESTLKYSILILSPHDNELERIYEEIDSSSGVILRKDSFIWIFSDDYSWIKKKIFSDECNESLEIDGFTSELNFGSNL